MIEKYKRIVLGLAVIGIGVIVYFLLSSGALLPRNSGSQGFGDQEVSLPKATGNIDETVNAFIKEANDEKIDLGSGEEEKALIISDSQEVSDFNQSADENEF